MNNWWIWAAGLILLGFFGSAFLSVVFAILGVAFMVIFTVFKVIFSIIGFLLAPLFGLLLLGGLGYIGYRGIQAMSEREDDLHHTTFKDRTSGGW